MMTTHPDVGDAPLPDPIQLCHDVLLGMAGRAPDELLTVARGWAAEGRSTAVARAVMFAALTYAVPLTERGLLGVAELLATADVDPSPLARADVAVDDVAPPFLFAGTPHADVDPVAAERVEHVAARTPTGPGTRGVWCAWRRTVDGSPWPAPRAVIVVEVAERSERVRTVATLQRALSAAGERDPQVEVYATDEELPSYQRLARAGGRLLWAATPARDLRVAQVFDDLDDEGNPSFRAGHPRLADEAERRRTVDYLDGGALLLSSPALGGDVLDTRRGPVVATNFRTDGTWIWSDALTYYVREHGLAPEDDLRRHLAGVDGRYPVVDGVDVHRAMATLSR